MPVLYLVEAAFAAMVLVTIVTQIVLPFLNGTPIFPALQRHGLEAKLEQAKQEVRIAELEKQLAGLQQRAEDIRQGKEN